MQKSIGHSLILAVMIISLWGATGAHAADQALMEKGKALSTECVACHGVDGNSPAPTFPKIAGQHEAYLKKQMMDLKARDQRDNAMMIAPMSVLSAEDIKALATYFSSQTLKPETAAHPEWKSMAEKLYRSGNTSRGIAACASCHGPAGRGIPDQYPSVAGQFADYLKTQLIAFRAGTRRNDVESPMQDSAKLLTDAEIDALSDYMSGLRLAK